MLKRKPIKIKKMNKKGNVDFGPAVLIAIIITLILVAPIMLRIIGTVTGTFFTQMNESNPDAVTPASEAVNKVYNFFDYLIVIGMFLNIILLFISSWFIDTNPIFILLYIIFAFILFLFLPNLVDAVDQVWLKMEDASAHDTWEDNSLNLTFTDFIRRNMIMFSLIIIGLTGVIIYAKFKLTQGQFT
jgi:flagellar biosynthesis protein FlhB